MKEATSRLILALDVPGRRHALAAVEALSGCIGCFKIGLELFTQVGPALVEEIRARGEHVFLDLKLHDIPNTVAGAVRSAGRLGVRFLTIHASGGRPMMESAAEAAQSALEPPRILAVTALTSLSEADVRSIGVPESPAAWAERLAVLAAESGLSGLVCSPQEAAPLRRRLGSGFMLVVPGIRPAGTARQDQARTATPAEAIRAGADCLVIGRPILQASDPREAALQIAADIAGSLRDSAPGT